MVSALLADAIANPTEALKDLFNPNADLDSFPQTVAAHFSAIFSNPDAFDEIPQLSITNPPEAHLDRALVRFRAMIQDTSLSPEIYLAKKHSSQCGGWGLGLDDGANDIDYTNLRECTVLWAVTIPGENIWVSQTLGSMVYSSNHAAHQPICPHKFPIPNVPHIGAQIKLYGPELFKSAELRTFVGILTSEPSAPLHSDVDSPIPTLVPTLHVLFSQPVPPVIIPRAYPAPPLPKTLELREELITWIAESSLAGDRDAAEYILLCAISRVQSRNPPILPLTITISRFPPPSGTKSTPTISHVLSQIFPVTVVLPLALETLNSTDFAPESKHEDLHSGRLQLPGGIICVLTEGGITEGIVSELGLTNLRTIQEVMSTQTLGYIFPFSRFAFNTDIAFVLLSEGRNSAFFQTDVNITLNSPGSATDFDLYKDAGAIKLPSKEKLEMFRSLVGAAKIGTVSVSEEMAQFIREDFVLERKTTALRSDALSSDGLVRRMMLARLCALSMQETEITIPIWERAKALAKKSSNKAAQ